MRKVMLLIFCALFALILRILLKVNKSNVKVQAKKMKIDSDKKFTPACLGDAVRVPNPDADVVTHAIFCRL